MKVSTPVGDLSHQELQDLAAANPDVRTYLDREAAKGSACIAFGEGGNLSFGEASTAAGVLADQSKVMNAFATTSPEFLQVALGALEWPTRFRGEKRGTSATSLNAAIALVRSVDPQNELEAALAMQMAATHSLSMEMLGEARHVGDRDAVESYVGIATKLQRTFTGQIEALAKLRTGGKQQVEVRHVYVDARGSQNIISAGGGGGSPDFAAQPHGTQDLEHVLGPALFSEDASRHGLSVPGDPGKEALPDTRRRQPRRTSRARERQLPARAGDEGSQGVAPGGGGAAGGMPSADEVDLAAATAPAARRPQTTSRAPRAGTAALRRTAPSIPSQAAAEPATTAEPARQRRGGNADPAEGTARHHRGRSSDRPASSRYPHQGEKI